MASYVNPAGEFDRDTRYTSTRITADGRDGFPVEPGRYRLIVSRACPWANRAIIVRRLLGLEPVLSMGVAGPTHDERSWSFDLDPGGRDPVLGIERLQQAFLTRFPDYDKGITVPAIVDIATGQMVTNDYAQMTLDFSTEWRAFHRPGAPDLYPEDQREEIDEVMDLVFRLPVLWAYARDLFQSPGFGDTIDFEDVKRHYYEVHVDINPTRIVPSGPDLSGWLEPHGRDALGGRPFGDGTAPGPPPPEETVPEDHTPLSAQRPT